MSTLAFNLVNLSILLPVGYQNPYNPQFAYFTIHYFLNSDRFLTQLHMSLLVIPLGLWGGPFVSRREIDPDPVRYEAVTTVKASMLVFWIVAPCGLAGRYQQFKAKNGGNMFLKMTGIYLQIPHGLTTQKTNIDTLIVSGSIKWLESEYLFLISLQYSSIKYYIIQHWSQ